MKRATTLSTIDRISSETGIPTDRMFAAHESALQLLDIDNNVIPFAVDVAVGRRDYRLIDAPETVHMGHRYKDLSRGRIPARAWRSMGDMRCSRRRTGVLADLGIGCLLPENILKALPLSPEFDLLREQYARLAEVLYFDRMTDDELREFLRYVRG